MTASEDAFECLSKALNYVNKAGRTLEGVKVDPNMIEDIHLVSTVLTKTMEQLDLFMRYSEKPKDDNQALKEFVQREFPGMWEMMGGRE